MAEKCEILIHPLSVLLPRSMFLRKIQSVCVFFFFCSKHEHAPQVAECITYRHPSLVAFRVKFQLKELFKGTRCEFWEGSEDAKETQHVQPTAATRNRTRDLEEEGEFGVRCSVFFRTLDFRSAGFIPLRTKCLVFFCWPPQPANACPNSFHPNFSPSALHPLH
jgi:hypothetical protein